MIRTLKIQTKMMTKSQNINYPVNRESCKKENKKYKFSSKKRNK